MYSEQTINYVCIHTHLDLVVYIYTYGVCIATTCTLYRYMYILSSSSQCLLRSTYQLLQQPPSHVGAVNEGSTNCYNHRARFLMTIYTTQAILQLSCVRSEKFIS